MFKFLKEEDVRNRLLFVRSPLLLTSMAGTISGICGAYLIGVSNEGSWQLKLGWVLTGILGLLATLCVVMLFLAGSKVVKK